MAESRVDTIDGWAFASKPATRRSFVTLAAAAAASSRMDGVGDGIEIFHVAIFRFSKEHINEAMKAIRAFASPSQGIDDDQAFCVAEHWVSPAAIVAPEGTEAFIHFGRDTLVKYATLRDTGTGARSTLLRARLDRRRGICKRNY